MGKMIPLPFFQNIFEKCEAGDNKLVISFKNCIKMSTKF